MRKTDFCIGENKGADQLRSNCEADQRLCFGYMDSTIPLLLTTEISMCNCTGRFVSDLVGNPEDRFSRVTAHFVWLFQILPAMPLLSVQTNSVPHYHYVYQLPRKTTHL